MDLGCYFLAGFELRLRAAVRVLCMFLLLLAVVGVRLVVVVMEARCGVVAHPFTLHCHFTLRHTRTRTQANTQIHVLHIFLFTRHPI